MSDNIPYEIQLEIIKKVSDVKSLIRCRAVSKPWKSFIDSPEFITGYGARDTNRLLLSYKVNSNEVKYVSFVDDVSFPQQQQDFAPNVTDFMKQLKYSKVIGSSYGLWCLRGYNSSEKKEMVVIWNPSIRKSVGIVVPRLLNNTSENVTHFGFGVCSSTYDPTIVGMSMYFRKNQHNKTWQVGIFKLSSKTWKISSNVPRDSLRVRPSTQVATGRFIFWVASEWIDINDGVSQNKHFILSFNLITHEFKDVNLPDSLDNSLNFSISKLSESLVVSAHIYEVDEIGYCLWMMGEEGGVMKSFTKLFTIKTPDLSIYKFLGFRKSGEPIMETGKDGEVFAEVEIYNPCSEHINGIGINGEDGSFFICPYIEALLLIDHSDGCVFSNDY